MPRSCRLDDSNLCALESSLLVLGYSDRLDRAFMWSDGLLREAAARRVAAWQAKLIAVRAELALRQGDLRRAYALDLARGLAALNAAQRAAGEAEQARRALYQALQLADVCGAERLQCSLLHRSRKERPRTRPRTRSRRTRGWATRCGTIWASATPRSISLRPG
ncbi:hypothetical protein ABZ619_09175 [Streptomyces sp. NPDC007851]|uniref:hypothetical protein n=1 Tax=Streptomyces sp. NPDC007851 TaxID=3155008 RepID=UPI0033E124C2